MRIETTDPITGRDVRDTEHAPFVVEGQGGDALKIYFESDETRQAYLEVEVKTPGAELIRVYNRSTGYAMEM